ncbi:MULTISPECIES: sensor histidine kinase [Paenibacillus]|uniref:sensor histidine kinase n=1 Tax=Paenibacillus TaxID=44249 RepID=UPI0022B8D53C|nr:sensor histidine kinase [Paenibacillus caseinilyticus]MCZ8520390.1 sensor histidine kinase [Paenibacillus caseinilyticus]
MRGRRWRDLLRDQPLLNKFILVSVVLISLPLIVASAVSYQGYASSIQRNVGKYQGDAVRELTANIDTYMRELGLLSTVPYQMPEVMQFLASEHTPGKPPSFDERAALEELVKLVFTNGRVDVVGLYLYGERGAAYVLRPDSAASFSEPGWIDQPWYAAASKTGKGVYIGLHEVRSTGGASFEVFSLARKLRSLETGEDLGYIVLDVDIRSVRSKLGQLSSTAYEDVALVDGAGRTVYTKGSRLTDEAVSGYRGTGTVTVHRDGREELLTYRTSEVTGWTTVETVPLSVLMKETLEVRRSIVGIGLVCLVLAAGLSIGLSLRITRPISRLRSLMKRVERGELGVSVPIESKDEVGQLSQTFNVMVSRLSDLGYRLYESEIREKDSQIAALQSQINPHFLYNTLGSISMYAELGGNREVVRMTNHLSRLLRYSISSERNEVALSKELEHVGGYMAIQGIRYEDRLTFVTEIDEELLGFSVIRLILQPVVENCMIHGFEKGDGSGTIRLSAVRDNGCMLITVYDDGLGIGPLRLQEIRRRITEAPLPDGPGGHGLVNVHRRIALRYGNQYGLSVESEPGAGTRVTLLLPLVAPRGEEDGGRGEPRYADSIDRG